MHTSSHLPAHSGSGPPRVPPDHVYTGCYCEENIYLLAKQFEDLPAHGWDVHVVFISNAQKLVALWQQKARDDVVIWDYHVVLVLRALSPSAGGQTAAWVYDFDTRLPLPCLAKEYVHGTFPYAAGDGGAPYTIPERYVSLFRVVPARAFLDYFASDRSHMLVEGRADAYTYPPPPYPPIRGMKAQGANNLMSCYVDMRAPESASSPSTVRITSSSSQPGQTGHATGDCAALQASAAGAYYGRVLDLHEWQTWLDTPPTDQPHRS